MEQQLDVERLIGARRALARAEHVVWQTLLDEHDRAVAAVQAEDVPVVSKQVGAQSVTLDVARALGLSEGSVWLIHSLGTAVRAQLPGAWTAFAGGVLDATRVRILGGFLRQARTPGFVEFLDTRAVGYAATHTPAELRAWLRRWRARLEPEHVAAEAEQALEHRRVEVFHTGDGTSWLNALLPTTAALAVTRRLRRAARALPALDPDTGDVDRRTSEQKQADLVAHWLTCSEGTTTDVRAEIAIAIDAEALAGYTGTPGTTLDGGHPVPAEWVRELARSETALFRRLVLDLRGRVLDTTSLGYQPSGAMRRALQWRDGRCRVVGCQASVETADLDHRTPWHRGGPSHPDNLQHLCRRHHLMKGHGRLGRQRYRPPVSYRERAPGPPLVVDMVHHTAAA